MTYDGAGGKATREFQSDACTGYKWVKEHKEESIVNSSMLEKAVVAVEALSPVFEYLVLPTGTKVNAPLPPLLYHYKQADSCITQAYGIHLPGNFIFGDQLPLRESLPRIPEPHASEMFYYWETDALTRLSEGKKWTWCEVRPDLVVGFVPNDNSHCLAQTLGIYLSLYRHVRGEGSEVPWPGTTKSYNVLSSQTSQDIMARFSIWASLNPEKTGGGEAFNVIDSNQASTWAERWSLICSLFGLKGVAFREDAMKPSDFMEKHRAEWDEVATIHGLRSGLLDNKVANPFFFDNILSFFDYDHQISADKIYKTGFTESWDEKKSWSLAFERFRKINVLP